MPDSLFWQAEARFDWATYVRDHGGVRALRANPDEYLLPCPDCNKLKIAVNVVKRCWQCFSCSEAGRDAASLVAKVERIPFGQSLIKVLEGHRQAIGRVDKIADDVLDSAPVRKPWKEMPWPDGFRLLAHTMTRETRPTAWGGYQPPLTIHREEAVALAYCDQRQIPPYVITEMRLGGCVGGVMRERLIFPCFDSGGRLVFYQGRATWAPRPRASTQRRVSSVRGLALPRPRPRSYSAASGPAVSPGSC